MTSPKIPMHPVPVPANCPDPSQPEDRMTDADRDKMLRDLHRALLEPEGGNPPLLDRLRDLHDALLEVPVGSDKEARPLLARINAVVQLHERASWTLRAGVYLATAGGTVAGAVMAIRGLWR